MSTLELNDYRIIHHTLRTAAHRMPAALAGFDAGTDVQASAMVKYWNRSAGLGALAVAAVAEAVPS